MLKFENWKRFSSHRYLSSAYLSMLGMKPMHAGQMGIRMTVNYNLSSTFAVFVRKYALTSLYIHKSYGI